MRIITQRQFLRTATQSAMAFHLLLCVSQTLPAQDKTLQTVAESSSFRATCTSAECTQFMENCAALSSHLTNIPFGSTVEDRTMLATIVAGEKYEVGERDERLRVLAIGNIHSGECAGKEALLMLLRDLATMPDHRWLKDLVLVIVPNYSADSNDKMAKDNRRGQIGPAEGMGERANAQGYDLNRDFMKLDSPEARALVKLIDDVDPHLFIDCHTTNGSRHRYALTYDIPHNPTTADSIRSYLREQMMPRITTTLEEQGTSTFYYGNFNAEHNVWTTYGHEPRYSTEYVGLRGRLAILSEAYSYISYKDRIAATKDFVTACIDDAQAHAPTARQLLHDVDAELVTAADNESDSVRISLDAKVVPFSKPFLVKGYKDNEPFDYECRFVGRFEPTQLTDLPTAYLIPADLPHIAEHLKRHGIAVEQLDEEKSMAVEIDHVDSITEAERPFQQHQMLRARTTRRNEERRLPAGTWRVPTAQPLGRLAAYLLEPASNDGLVVWNFFPKESLEGQDYPILRTAE